MSLLGLFANFISNSAAREIVQRGLAEALQTMQSMIGNEGQQSVYTSYIIDKFVLNSSASPEDGWEDVDAAEYIDFMGEIVEAGNKIMQNAYNYASDVQAEFDDYYDLD